VKVDFFSEGPVIRNSLVLHRLQQRNSMSMMSSLMLCLVNNSRMHCLENRHGRILLLKKIFWNCLSHISLCIFSLLQTICHHVNSSSMLLFHQLRRLFFGNWVRQRVSCGRQCGNIPQSNPLSSPSLSSFVVSSNNATVDEETG
jgi:hypothetical protein